MKSGLSRATWACAVYFLLHVVAHFSAAAFVVVPGVSLWYPPCGLALALLVLVGPRCAWVVLVANIATAVLTPGLGTWWAPLLFSALITANYTAVALLVRRSFGPRLLPGTSRETLGFALVMVVAPAGVAFAGTGLLLWLGLMTPEEFFEASIRWWVGDASGLLTVVPVAMVFAGPWLQGIGVKPSPELRGTRLDGITILQAAVLLVSLWVVFAVDPLPRYHAYYLCFLPLIWICLRHGLLGATLATLAITMGSLIGLRVTGGSTEMIVNFLFFELTVAVTGLGLGSAVSRRNAAEQGLAASEARLDRVIAGAQLGVWDWNISTQRVVYNERCAEILGCRLDEIGPAYVSWERLIHPGDRERVAAALTEHLEGRSPLFEVDYCIQRRDQHWRWIHTRGSVVARDREGRPQLVSGTHLDITDRERAEAEARRLLGIIEATTDFILTTDRDGRVLYANTALLRLLGAPGLEQLRTLGFGEIFPEAAARTFQQQIVPTALAGRAWQGEVILHDADDREVPVSLVALAHRDEENDTARLSFVLRDISPQKRAEAEKLENERRMLRVQKAESLGALAGGLAHEFNNLLTAMLGNTSLARLDLAPGSSTDVLLGKIENAAARAAELCQQMLAYAGRSSLAFTEVNLTELIQETRQLLQISVGKKIKLDLQLARPLAPIRGASPQLQQAMMNLALNAAEAIGTGAGTIVIRTSLRRLETDELREMLHASLPKAGSFALLEMQDNGGGIRPEHLSRIFEPFFTTKVAGHGLGLAAVLEIVKAHCGAIQVVSAPGEGSTFRLAFPAIESTAASPGPVSPPAAEWRGTGLVLLVDDDPNVRDLTALLLESFGFTVLTAADGIEGVDQFRAHVCKLRCVLLDLTMPRMDGETALIEMRRINSDVPVILISGYSEKLTPARFADVKSVSFLPKPFTRDGLFARVRSVLTGTGPT